MNPTYLSALTLMVVPNSPLDDMIRRGEFDPMTDPRDILKELEQLIENIDVPGPVIFRTNHASNYLPLKGNLPEDKAALLDLIQSTLKNPALLRAESLRGL